MTKIKKIINKSSSLTSPNKLKLLFTIVERSKAEFYVDTIETFDVNMQYVIYGKGTAPSNLFLSLGDNHKAVIISVIREDKIKDCLSTLEDRFEKTKNGKGIAYTIPLSSVIGVMVYQFLSNTEPQRKGDK